MTDVLTGRAWILTGALLLGCGSMHAAQSNEDESLAGAYQEAPSPGAREPHAEVAAGHTRDVSPRQERHHALCGSSPIAVRSTTWSADTGSLSESARLARGQW